MSRDDAANSLNRTTPRDLTLSGAIRATEVQHRVVRELRYDETHHLIERLLSRGVPVIVYIRVLNPPAITCKPGPVSDTCAGNRSPDAEM
jgi:hypothetical protein